MIGHKNKVYVAGPYTNGDVAQNVRHAIKAGDELFGCGYIPFIPHLTHFWHMLSPRPYEQWLIYDDEWLPHCHFVCRLPGESNGADREVELAQKLGIPVHDLFFFQNNRYFPPTRRQHAKR